MKNYLIELCHLAPSNFRVNDHGEIWAVVNINKRGRAIESFIHGRAVYDPTKIRNALEFFCEQRGWVVTQTHNPHVANKGHVTINDNAGSVYEVEFVTVVEAFVSCVVMALQGES